MAHSIVDYIARWLLLKFDKPYGPIMDIQISEESLALADSVGQLKNSMFDKIKRVDARICPDCGTLLIRTGSCYGCGDCGYSGGCG
jgi:ribonucleoside-diphosphate reductase alpha chain